MRDVAQHIPFVALLAAAENPSGERQPRASQTQSFIQPRNVNASPDEKARPEGGLSVTNSPHGSVRYRNA